MNRGALASCQFYVGAEQMHSSHLIASLGLCFVNGGKVGMKGAPNDIAEIALPRSTVRRPSASR